LPNGLALSGIEDRELPTAMFELAVDGGRLADDPSKPGGASLLARMMTRGTARRTPAQLEDALKSLGADIEVEARDEQFVFSGRTLARNFGPTIDLLEEMLLEPRWDTAELALAKAAAVSDIQAERAEPESLADRVFEAVTYGEDHIYARSRLGTERSVAATTMEDLKRYHAAWLVPNKARFRVVGAVEDDEVRRTLADLGSRWARRDVALPRFAAPRAPAASKVYFYDLPGAKQSVFAFGRPGPKRADPAYYPAAVTNYILGGGGFASRLTQQLREGKGYTYGIGSSFSGGAQDGLFRIHSGVRSNVTLEAAALTRDILKDYGSTFTEADLAVTQSFLTKSRARAFETQAQKLAYLANIGDYGLPTDYPRREQAVVDGMTVERIRALAGEHIRPGAMTYVIVGDAKTQAARLKALGFGEPVMINETLARLER
jgi:zinc protease